MRVITGGLVLGLSVASVTVAVQADERRYDFDANGRTFKRIATVPNYINNADRDVETVSEIVAVNADGNLLVYTDAETESIGLVDIQDPKYPMPIGVIRRVQAPSFEDAMTEQIKEVTDSRGQGDLRDALYTRNTWDVD